MAKILEDISRTFSEYLLIPRLTRKGQRADLVNLATPLAALGKSPDKNFHINVPVVSACMQAVSGTSLSIALARQGGLSFIFCSQAIDTQAEMVRQVKAHKAGFVQSDSNATASMTLEEVMELMASTGHSTVPVTHDGSATGKLEGIITDKDFWVYEDDLSRTVGEHMTQFTDVIHGEEGISLREANELLHRHKKDCLPVVDKQGHLSALVFKKIMKTIVVTPMNYWMPQNVYVSAQLLIPMISGSESQPYWRPVRMRCVSIHPTVLPSTRWKASNGFVTIMVMTSSLVAAMSCLLKALITWCKGPG